MHHILKEKIKSIIWTISAIIIGIFFMSFIFNNVSKKIQTQKLNPNTNTAMTIGSTIEINTMQKYFYAKKDSNQKPKISANAYLIGDLDTGEIIISKNQDQQFPIASVSKLMTATVATDLTREDDITKVSKKALSTYGQNGNFKLREKIKVTDLIYPLLLESSNDAAEIIAEHFDRNIFLKKMNQEALRLDLSKTTFSDPSGLSSKNQSTVLDMFKLAGYIDQKKPDLLQITTKKSYSTKSHNWFSTNQFLLEDGYLGGKSGYTDPAKETVVSLFSIPLGETGTRNIAITLLQSKDRYKDVENLLQYLNKNIYYG